MLRLIALQADPNVTDFQGQSGGVKIAFDFYLHMTGWWFPIFLIFIPIYLGKIPILTHIFQRG